MGKRLGSNARSVLLEVLADEHIPAGSRMWLITEARELAKNINDGTVLKLDVSALVRAAKLVQKLENELSKFSIDAKSVLGAYWPRKAASATDSVLIDPQLDAHEQADASNGVARIAAQLGSLRQLGSALHSMAEGLKPKRGRGRHQLERQFVFGCAHLWKTVAGTAPGRSVDAMSHQEGGSFKQFVQLIWESSGGKKEAISDHIIKAALSDLAHAYGDNSPKPG
jgi:hypothetical protein